MNIFTIRIMQAVHVFHCNSMDCDAADPMDTSWKWKLLRHRHSSKPIITNYCNSESDIYYDPTSVFPTTYPQLSPPPIPNYLEPQLYFHRDL